MSFGQLKKLAYLIWLSFSFDFLQVDQLWDVRVHEYVVASSDTVKPKTKSFNKTPEIREGDIPESAGRKLSEQSSTIHARASDYLRFTLHEQSRHKEIVYNCHLNALSRIDGNSASSSAAVSACSFFSASTCACTAFNPKTI